MKLMQKRDLFPAVATGFTTGLIGWQILVFLDRPDLFGISLAWLMLIVPVLWAAGVALGYFLGRWLPPFIQFGKFAAIGFANAAVDFGVLYLFIGATGETSGAPFTLFKAASFVAATTHSYFWNKYWAFEASGSKGGAGELTKFFIVAVLALLVNVGVATLVVNVIGPQFGLSDAAWAGAGAVAGSALSLIFSFVGFRLVVFRHR